MLLSGPPKSGKTFTAEMLALHLVCSTDYIPYQVNQVEDFEKFYDPTLRQVFLFDDAFGKHNLDTYRADLLDRKLDLIFEQIDENHKCLFTSREYVLRAFHEYTDKALKEFIDRILVETSRITKGERESLLKRYHQVKFSSELTLAETLLDSIVTHKNFSPETVRSYFDDCSNFDLNGFLEHLKAPDKYLERVFANLHEEKRVVLLALLFSLHGSTETIAYAFENISSDQKKTHLVNLGRELKLLEGSIIRSDGERFEFYHPSMFEFFVGYLGNDVSIYRSLLLRNINPTLIALIRFHDPQKSNKIIHLKGTDLGLLTTGFERVIHNPHVKLSEINSSIAWFDRSDIQLTAKVSLKTEFKQFSSAVFKAIARSNLFRFVYSEPYALGFFLSSIKASKEIPNANFLIALLKERKSDPVYWVIVFRTIPLLSEQEIFDDKILGRQWLNNFYLELKTEVNSLGDELYGSAYPDFKEVMRYESLIEEKQFEEAAKIKFKNKSQYKRDTNRQWFPRFKIVKEKMNILKTSHPHGYKIYEMILPLYGHLTSLQDNQRNRYLFNKAKKWWD